MFYSRGILVSLSLLTAALIAHDLPPERVTWTREEWVAHLSAPFSGPVNRVPWGRLQSLLTDPLSLEALDRLDMVHCTKKFRETVAFYSGDLEGFPNGYLGGDFAKVEATHPGIFSGPNELHSGIPRDIKGLARERGWFYLEIDEGLGDRIIVGVPASKKQKFAQWYNIGTKEDRGSRLPFVVAQMSVVETTVTEKDGRVVKKFTPFFNKRSAAGFGHSFRASPHAVVRNCIECHLSGMHDVFVSSEPSTLKTYSGVRPVDMRTKINKAFKDYGELDWGPWLHVDKLGPTVDLEAIATALERRGTPTDISPKTLTQMNCVNCHGPGDTRGSLNVFGMKGKKHIAEKIMDGSMPPKGKDPRKQLTIAERRQLVTFIEGNYALQLLEWTQLADCLKKKLVDPPPPQEKTHSKPAS